MIYEQPKPPKQIYVPSPPAAPQVSFSNNNALGMISNNFFLGHHEASTTATNDRGSFARIATKGNKSFKLK